MNDTNTNAADIAKSLTGAMLDGLDYYCGVEGVIRSSGTFKAYDLAKHGLVEKDDERSTASYVSPSYPITVTDLGRAVQAASLKRTTPQRKKRAAALEHGEAASVWTGYCSANPSDYGYVCGDTRLAGIAVGEKAFVHAQGKYRRGIVVSVTSKRISTYYVNKDAGTQYLKTTGFDCVYVERATPPADDTPDYEETVEEEAERLTTPTETPLKDRPFVERNAAIRAEIERFPATFGLRGHAGTFRISERASYVNDAGEIMLYTQIQNPIGDWHDFTKGTVAELAREHVEIFEREDDPDGAASDLPEETREAVNQLLGGVNTLVREQLAPKLKATRTGKEGLYTVETSAGPYTLVRGARKYIAAEKTHRRTWTVKGLGLSDTSKGRLLDKLAEHVAGTLEIAERSAAVTSGSLAPVEVPRSTAKPTAAVEEKRGFVNPKTKRLTPTQKRKAAKAVLVEEIAQLSAAGHTLGDAIADAAFDATALRALKDEACAMHSEIERLADEVEAFGVDAKDAKAAHKGASKAVVRYVVRAHEWGFVPSGSPKASSAATVDGFVEPDESRGTSRLRLTALGRAVAKLAGAKPVDRRLRPFAGIEDARIDDEQKKALASCSLCGKESGSNAESCARCEQNAEVPPMATTFTEEDEKATIARMDATEKEDRDRKRTARLEVLAPLRRVVRVGIVSCGKTKASEAAPVRELYTSSLFRKSVAHAEQLCDEVLVASAKHGLLNLDDTVAPYDATLSKLTKREVSRWEALVHAQLRILYPEPLVVELVVYAGTAYADSIGAAMTRYVRRVPLHRVDHDVLETLRSELSDPKDLRPEVLEQLEAYVPKAFTEEDGDRMIADLEAAGLIEPEDDAEVEQLAEEVEAGVFMRSSSDESIAEIHAHVEGALDRVAEREKAPQSAACRPASSTRCEELEATLAAVLSAARAGELDAGVLARAEEVLARNWRQCALFAEAC